MRVFLFHEAICPPGVTWAQRMREIIDEAVVADDCGFHGYAMSEQHFASGEAITSAPEIVLPFVAARTKRMRLRIASVNLLPRSKASKNRGGSKIFRRTLATPLSLILT